jgi:hypothetical protein
MDNTTDSKSFRLHFLAAVKQQVVKVYSHNQLLTLLSAAIGSFDAEMTYQNFMAHLSNLHK